MGGAHGGGNMGFGNNINFQFHYTDEQIAIYNMSEDHIKINVWNAQTNSWGIVARTIDNQNDLITFSTNSVSNFIA